MHKFITRRFPILWLSLSGAFLPASASASNTTQGTPRNSEFKGNWNSTFSSSPKNTSTAQAGVLSAALSSISLNTIDIIFPLCNETQCSWGLSTVSYNETGSPTNKTAQSSSSRQPRNLKRRQSSPADRAKHLIVDDFTNKYLRTPDPVYWLREKDSQTGCYKAMIRVQTQPLKDAPWIAQRFGGANIIRPYHLDEPFPVDQVFPVWLLLDFSKWMEKRVTRDKWLYNNPHHQEKIKQFSKTVSKIPWPWSSLETVTRILNDVKRNAVGTDARLLYLRHKLMTTSDNIEWLVEQNQVSPDERRAVRDYLSVIQLTDHSVSMDIRTALNSARAWRGLGLGNLLYQFLEERMKRIGKILDKQIALDRDMESWGFAGTSPWTQREQQEASQSHTLSEFVPPPIEAQRYLRTAKRPVVQNNQTVGPSALVRLSVTVARPLRQLLSSIRLRTDDPASAQDVTARLQNILDMIENLTSNQNSQMQVAQEINTLALLLIQVYQTVRHQGNGSYLSTELRPLVENLVNIA